jgi:hypothetical protein
MAAKRLRDPVDLVIGHRLCDRKLRLAIGERDRAEVIRCMDIRRKLRTKERGLRDWALMEAQHA